MTDLCSKYSSSLSLNDENKKCWKKNDFSNTKNNSTLSRHISAYENSNEASFDSFNQSFRKSWLIQKQKQNNPVSTFVSQNPFEFQRQQNDKMPEPEVSQFKASQRLLKNSNKRSFLRAEQKMVDSRPFLHLSNTLHQLGHELHLELLGRFGLKRCQVA
uniref:Uncharacterized protein n=1 Tax=Panagrolaimus sp. PS1159 TaxID=55785 RepID=A0AC35F9E5_9BILA